MNLAKHHKPNSFSDYFAKKVCSFFRRLTDLCFQKRYGHRAVVLETIAGVPGMIGGMLMHFKCLRNQCDDDGWIKTLLDEAENERMHLMTFIQIAKPNWFERFIIISAQGLFSIGFLLLYIVSPKTAHRLVGYFEEEAIISYGLYLKEIDEGKIENVPAPAIAIKYWNLPASSRLREVVMVIREDEARHRDANHKLADVAKSL